MAGLAGNFSEAAPRRSEPQQLVQHSLALGVALEEQGVQLARVQENAFAEAALVHCDAFHFKFRQIVTALRAPHEVELLEALALLDGLALGPLALAFSSVKNLVDADDKLLPIGQWSPEAAAAVSSVEVAKRNYIAGDGVQEDVVKIRLWDKTKSLNDLMKHLGLLVDRVDVRVDVEVMKGLQRGREFNRLAEARDGDVVDVTPELNSPGDGYVENT